MPGGVFSLFDLRVATNLQLAGRRWCCRLGLGGRARGGQQSHGILEDVRQIESAGRLVTLAGAALRRLAGADEGLLRGRLRAVHVADAGVQRRRYGQRKALAVGI
jgi:hypothetical protein